MSVRLKALQVPIALFTTSLLLLSAGCATSDSYKRGDERLRDFVGGPEGVMHLNGSERDIPVTCKRLLDDLRDRGEQLVGQDFIEGCTDAAKDLGIK